MFKRAIDAASSLVCFPRPDGPGGYSELDRPAAAGSTCWQRWKPCLFVIPIVLSVIALVFSYTCHIIKEPLLPIVPNGASLTNTHLGGRTTLNYWNLPFKRSPELLAECNAALQNVTEKFGGRWGQLPAADAARWAFRCTKVPGLFEQVPEKLRGVFWMKGNPYPEELAVLQMGQYFPQERVYVAPHAPFMWAWPDSTPARAPMGGIAYKPALMKILPMVMPMMMLGFSVRFLECPGRWRLPFPFGLPGHVCSAGSGKAPEMVYASLQAHTMGNISQHVEQDHYTLEEEPSGVEPGAVWHRGIYGGPPLLGRCKCVSIGSYSLTKIIDAKGEPLEPYFSEWVEYMGDIPLNFWGGITDAMVLDLLESDRFEEAAERFKELWCADNDDPTFGACDGKKGLKLDPTGFA
mmetsp:Transcript_1504/g.4249  ORF Transcript_1504/g.4249 Transcript_1504/m.4249 type:complete len:407 (-) Transcript_1504:82-1302(-)